MTITCGTDFSDHGTQAAEVAGALARKLGLPLKLVHVFDELGVELAFAEGRVAICDGDRARLHVQADHLREAHGIEVEAVAVPGVAADKLVEVATLARSSLLVVGALGRERRARWLLGSVAERVAQASSVPVLVIRDAAAFRAWARDERPLRVMVGVEPTANSRAALRWATELRRFGACELLVTQVVWPIEQHERLGVPLPMPLDRLRPEVEQVVLRDLQCWAGVTPDPCSFFVRSGWGRVANHLTQLADEVTADLIVVGTHQRAGVARLWQGSVSRGVLHDASMNVACVPPGSVIEDAVALPAFRRILAPTDFSPLANHAIPTAYGLAGRGGQVHLFHVAEPGASGGVPSVEDRLRALVPSISAERGVETTFEIVTGVEVGAAIAQAAGRLGADAICMATHGRSGVAKLVLGSQAQEVLRRSRQPVVLVPPERDG